MTANASLASGVTAPQRGRTDGAFDDTSFVSPIVVIVALAIVVGLSVLAFVVYRLRKLDPVAFHRAINNGGLFYAGLLALHLADLCLDILACVSVADDRSTPPHVVGLFSALSAIAVVVSIIEIAVDAKALRRLTRGKLDIDAAARLSRHVAYAECLTLLAEDVPMLLVAGALLHDGGGSGECSDHIFLLLVVIFSAMMVGMKMHNLRPLLEHLLAKRTYEEGDCANAAEEMANVDSRDLQTLVDVVDDFTAYEVAVCAGEQQQQEQEGEEVASGAMACHSALVVDDDEITKRIQAVLKDLKARPLDMDSPQLRLDAMAIVLELAYPHRYQHLQRSAEATAQALTQAAVSQNEFYAVVLPYLMLLYDKAEMAAAKAADRHAQSDGNGTIEITSSSSDADDGTGSNYTTVVIGGSSAGFDASGTRRTDRSECLSPSWNPSNPPRRSFSRSQSMNNSTDSPKRRGVGFSMVRLVQLREAELHRVASGDDSFAKNSLPNDRRKRVAGGAADSIVLPDVPMMATMRGAPPAGAFAPMTPLATAQERFHDRRRGRRVGARPSIERTTGVAFQSTRKLVGRSRREFEGQFVSFELPDETPPHGCESPPAAPLPVAATEPHWNPLSAPTAGDSRPDFDEADGQSTSGKATTAAGSLRTSECDDDEHDAIQHVNVTSDGHAHRPNLAIAQANTIATAAPPPRQRAGENASIAPSSSQSSPVSDLGMRPTRSDAAAHGAEQRSRFALAARHLLRANLMRARRSPAAVPEHGQ